MADALAKHSDLGSSDTFRAVFGDLTFSATAGGGTRWGCERSANPSGVACTSGTQGLNPRLMAHELGHVFNAMYVNRIGENNKPYNMLGTTTILDSAGNWITGLRYDPEEGGREWSRGYDGYRFNSDGIYYEPMLYHGPYVEGANSVGEEFADMFLNWAYNSYDSSDAGTARYNWMDQEVSRALSVMLNK